MNTFLYVLFLSSIIIIIILLIKNNNIEHFKIDQNEIKSYFNQTLNKPYPKYKIKKNAIFVSIASYRDDECSDTLKSLFKNATHPENIYVGICSQNHPNNKNEECIPSHFKYLDHIRIKRLKHTDALGPNYARYMCSHLWRGEEYYMQIDSHIQFIKNWDKIIINMYKSLPHPKCVLTHYPPASFDSKPSHTCSSHFENNFHIISEAKIIENEKINKPIRTPYFSAGLFFTNSHFLYEIPYDPYIPYLFQGEEILMASRLYTNGWDMYNLSKPIAIHNYERDDKPHFWNDNSHKNWEELQNESNKRYYKMIGQKTEIHPEFKYMLKKFGMGNIRSIDDYFNFTGINMKDKKVTSRCGYHFNDNKNQWLKL